MSDIAFHTATQLADKIEKKEISSLELCDLYISRIEKYDPALNAMPIRDFDRAREAAKTADNTPEDQRGSLHGVPMSIKESYNIAGLPTTWGIPGFKKVPITADSEAVKRFKSAGAVFLGKTNVPVNLGDFQTYNPIYGQTNNPWDVTRTPGGSSGGSAAALAAGLTGLETGSDIGGSIRNPAHYCGVYGHKPSWCIVPPQGHALPGVLASPDIAVCGPLARSAEDLQLSMDIIAGPQPLDDLGWRLELPRYADLQLKNLRVAIWSNDTMCPVDSEIENRIHQIGQLLEREGASVSWEARPSIDVRRAHATYMGLMHSIMGAGAGDEAYKKGQKFSAALDPNDTSDMALLTRAMVMTHRDWLRINNHREKIRYAWQAFFKDYDILLCPQNATTAFVHDHSPIAQRTITVNGAPQPYFQQVYWSGFAIASYLPSTVFPTGPSEAGLPIGIQAMSGAYQDYKTIQFAKLVTERIGGFQVPEGFE